MQTLVFNQTAIVIGEICNENKKTSDSLNSLIAKVLTDKTENNSRVENLFADRRFIQPPANRINYSYVN